MINPKKLEEIAKQISNSMPEGVKQLAEGMESKTKQVIQHKLSQLDFVSREEFDIQTQVLQRTREKLAALELKIAELEQALQAKTAQQATASSDNQPDSE
ncbi:ubiquinone biosynthesis accessory factor UbiK [Flocculibacter collagenilyticus]|uniref:ubiquinone biosynthesis accessory factor UbiK n=1 Tax=Flocculibacter collagenilyticus TaxID=2744479 RepID=UPI0018F4A4B1|nr:accessory factor UbiK family protein [Flocculibacter collagenilyticus]